jgi:hypothetical protein
MIAVGARVTGQWHNGQWYPGRIGQVRQNMGVTEFFVEFDDGDRAWVTVDRVRPVGAPMGKGAGPALGYAPQMALVPGSAVLADWTEDSWYEGYLAEANSNNTLFFVQFDDGDTKWLPPQKIRPRPGVPALMPGSVAHLPVGTRVSGLWHSGSWYPGVVGRQNANQSMCFVQFDDGDTKWLGSQQLTQTGPAPRTAAAPQAVGAAGFAPGARVSGEWSAGAWYPGHIAEVSPDGAMFFVQFDDGDTAWLSPAQIRSQGAPAGGFAPPPAAPAPAPAAAPAWPNYGAPPAHPGAPAAPAPAPPQPAAPAPERFVEKVIERQVLVVRCQYCRSLTPADVNTCKDCGARLH